MGNFVHLHVHTEYSLLDGAARIGKVVKVAKEMGLTISCDLNYRKKLWTKEKAKEVMTHLAPFIDVCIANEEDASKMKDVYANDYLHPSVPGYTLLGSMIDVKWFE